MTQIADNPIDMLQFFKKKQMIKNFELRKPVCLFEFGIIEATST